MSIPGNMTKKTVNDKPKYRMNKGYKNKSVQVYIRKHVSVFHKELNWLFLCYI